MFGFNRRDVSLAYNFFLVNFRDRYLGSKLGRVWAVANPVFLLGLFTFVFGFVYKTRLPGAETTLAYVTWLISGYGPWMAASEAISSSATSVVSASGLIKNLAFKSEVLPIAASAMSIVPLCVSVVFLVILMILDGNVPTWHIIWVPLVLVLQSYFVVALGMWLSALTVFIRDITFVIPNALTMLLFATPIFYPIESMPSAIRKVSEFNPFYILVEGYRQPLVHHHSPSIWSLGYVAVLSTVLFYFGLRAFRRVKGHFDSVL